jgi:hypothetical protein
MKKVSVRHNIEIFPKINVKCTNDCNEDVRCTMLSTSDAVQLCCGRAALATAWARRYINMMRARNAYAANVVQSAMAAAVAKREYPVRLASYPENHHRQNSLKTQCLS